MELKKTYDDLSDFCKSKNVCLVAVSKTKPIEQIADMYTWGQRVFGENRVLELVEKHNALPDDIEWHMIGHLQRNKVKDIVPFVSMIHSGDSARLIHQINKEAKAVDRCIDILLQLKIAKEESKYGWDIESLVEFLEPTPSSELTHIRVRGVMGMATFTSDMVQVRSEFSTLKSYHTRLQPYFDASFDTISMGMTGDYEVAIEEGSTMIRVGSLLFGAR